MYSEKDLNLARLAAYIDGEGTVDLQGSSQGGKRSYGYKLRISIVNTDLRLLVWCKENFGGHIRMNRPGGGNHRPVYSWTISGAEQVGNLLKGCLPFFVIKREQAEIGIAFGKTFSSSNRDPRGLSDSIKQKRESLRAKLFEIRHTSRVA